METKMKESRENDEEKRSTLKKEDGWETEERKARKKTRKQKQKQKYENKKMKREEWKEVEADKVEDENK